MATSTSSAGTIPKDFRAASVTFVSVRDGWVLGSSDCAVPPCSLVLLRTSDGGNTWVSIPAPPSTFSQDYQSGVRAVRFADLNDGWMFGPDLWDTHDGGAHWARSALAGPNGGAVYALEAAAGVVHAAVLDNSRFAIVSSPVGRDSWQASPTTITIGAGPVPAVQIVLQGQVGWLIENDRTVIGGARLDHGAWASWQPPCMTAGGPATLAASAPASVAAVCDQGIWSGGPPAVRAYFSTDGGTTFHQTATPIPVPDNPGALASPTPSTVVIGNVNNAGNPVLVATFDGGATWTTVYTGAISGPWTDVGFTTSIQGVAIEGPSGARGILLKTSDGGHTWKPVLFHAATA